MKTIDLRRLPSSREVVMCRDEGYFPVLVSPRGDDILAVVRAGAGHVGVTGRLDALRSTDGGSTWTEPGVIVHSEADDRNPAVGVTPDGTVILAYHQQASYDERGLWAPGVSRVEMRVTRSADGGRTWEPYRSLGFAPMAKHSAYGHIVNLSDGTMLLPIYGRPAGRDKQPDQSCILRSRDGGRTWKEPSVMAEGHNEAGLLVLPGGDVLAAIRVDDRDQPLAVCRSADRGHTWSAPTRVTGASEHPAALTVLSNGWVLMVFGVRHEPFGVQALVSKDEGRTWDPRRLVVCDDLGQNDLGYPSTVRLGDRLVTAYYCAPGRWNDPQFRGEGSFARALLYDERALISALA